MVSLLAATRAEAVRSPLLYTGYQSYQPYQQYYQPYHGYQSYHGYPGYHGYNYSPYYSFPYTPQTMMAYRAAPAPAPYTVGSQFHSQDELGNINYGYSNINSAKQEVGNTYGGVQGGKA